jgi:hypothetical protein
LVVFNWENNFFSSYGHYSNPKTIIFSLGGGVLSSFDSQIAFFLGLAVFNWKQKNKIMFGHLQFGMNFFGFGCP